MQSKNCQSMSVPWLAANKEDQTYLLVSKACYTILLFSSKLKVSKQNFIFCLRDPIIAEAKIMQQH